MKENKAITLGSAENQELVDLTPGTTPMELMARMVLAGEADIEVLERLRAMAKEDEAEQSKRSFYRALVAFQMSCPPIPKTKPIPDSKGNAKYHYAPLDTIEPIVRPVLRDNGLGYRFDTLPSERGCTVVCILFHAEGHSEASSVYMPGIKIPNANEGQNHAGAMTMAQRRALCNALGITPEDDHDGSIEAPEPEGCLSEEQQANIQCLADEVGADLDGIVRYAKAESLDTIPRRKYPRIIEALEARR